MKLRFILSAFALAFSASAHADISIDTRSFTFTSMDSYSYMPVEARLISDQGGITKFNLLSTNWGFDLGSVNQGGNGNSVLEYLNLSIKSGYELTGFSFSGDVVGQSLIGGAQHTGSMHFTPGAADNFLKASTALTNGIGGESYSSKMRSFTNLNGGRHFNFETNGLQLTGDKVIEIGGYATIFASDSSYAVPFEEYTNYFPSTAGIRMENATLTVFTQPIPEPETYALMGMGLLALAGVARRRK